MEMQTHRMVIAVLAAVAGVVSGTGCPSAAAVEVGARASVAALAYPQARAPSLAAAGASDSYPGNVQSVLELHASTAITDSTTVEAEAAWFRDNHGTQHLEGEAYLRRDGRWSVAAGLLRERWGRAEGSELDILAPPVTAFSLVDDHGTVSQPGVHVWSQLGGVRLDAHALIGRRAQPMPGSDARLSFGVPVREVVDAGPLGRSALAVRLSGAGSALDWSVHAFTGLARRPDFVAAPTATGIQVDLVYQEITQIGAELETSAGSWRLWTEGFVRRNARGADGSSSHRVHAAASAEHQYFGAMGNRFDLFTELRLAYDSRGKQADRPFQNAVRLGWKALGTSAQPLELEAGVLYDWTVKGSGWQAAARKQISAAPLLKVGIEVLAFDGGSRPSLLDVFQDDLQVSLRLEWEL